MSEDKSDCAVRIAVREKPLCTNADEEAESSVIGYHELSANILVVDERPFTFDHVLRPTTTQQEIFEELIRPLVNKVKQGYNCTALAYGQTGTGKSYTMGLNSNSLEGQNVGIIPRCLKEILLGSENEENVDEPSVNFEVLTSFIEIYNEKVYDLLAEDSTLPIIARGYKYTGGTRKPLVNMDECYRILLQGNKNRHVRPTKMNSQSSRSHAIFTIHVRSKGDAGTRTSCLNLVDLAGSEGVRRTGHRGMAMHEGVHINQGLLSIGKVLQAISMGSKIIPYRDSVLSSVLQDSFNANSYLTLLACISPYRADLSETLSTLRFAQSAKQLKHTPHVTALLAELKKNKVKTPYKLAAVQNKNLTSAQKRPYAQTNQHSASKVNGYHSNTFSTPSKFRRLEANKLNQTEMGLTPKEKQKVQSSTMRPAIPTQPVFAPPQADSTTMGSLAETTAVHLVNNRESLLDRTLDSRASLMSLNVSSSTAINANNTQMATFSPILRCMLDIKSVVEKLEDITQTQQKLQPNIAQSTPFGTALVSPLRKEIKSIVAEVLMDKLNLDRNACADDTVALLRPQHKQHNKSFTTSSPVFKVPEAPTVRKTNIANVDMSLEEDYNCFAETSLAEQTVRNTSVRRRHANTNHSQLESTIEPNGTLNSTLRRSLRISMRHANLTSSMLDDTAAFKTSISLSSTSVTGRSTAGRKRRSLMQLHNERRRSVRLAAHLEEPEPSPENVKKKHTKAMSKGRSKNAVKTLDNTVIASYFSDQTESSNKKANKTKHRKAILDLLNKGTMKEVQLLPQVGPKTAYQLVTQRTLNGKFKSLTQVEKLPIWRGRSWERFAEANML